MSTGAERQKRFRKNNLAKGLCVTCGKRLPKMGEPNGKVYKNCAVCITQKNGPKSQAV